MAEGTNLATSEVTVTETITVEDETPQSPTLHLKLKKPKSDKKVVWTAETVDNENMGKKKSKCCCIYEKPKVFGESSSSEDEDETDHCHGHKKKCYRHGGGHDHQHDHYHDHGGADSVGGPSGSGPTPGPSGSVPS